MVERLLGDHLGEDGRAARQLVQVAPRADGADVRHPAVSGLFGTFKMQMTLVGSKRQQTRRIVHRSQVKVFNASLSKSAKLLSIGTLRALALALPEQYAFPERKDIPEGHLAEDPDEKQEPKRKGPRRDWSKAMPKQPSKDRRSSASKDRQSSSSESEFESDSSDEDTESSGSSLSAEGDEDEDVETAPEAAGPTSATAGVPNPDVPNPDVPLLTGPSLEPELDTVIALNMADDPEYADFEHPVGFAYVCSTDPFEVYWYQCKEDQLQGKARGKSERAFRHSSGAKSALKTLTISKYWNNPDWFKTAKKGARPTEDQILANWHRSGAHRNWIMPVTVRNPPATGSA